MATKVCIAELVGENNYAVISPDRLVFGLGASTQELQQLVAEETALLALPSEEVVGSSQEVSLGLIPTFDCNLRCGYCYARGGESKEVLSVETGKSHPGCCKKDGGCGKKHGD